MPNGPSHCARLRHYWHGRDSLAGEVEIGIWQHGEWIGSIVAGPNGAYLAWRPLLYSHHPRLAWSQLQPLDRPWLQRPIGNLHAQHVRICLPHNRNCCLSVCRRDNPQGDHRITVFI